jgi:all-trans-retinol dehydrogenase (NAD+)
MELRSLGKHGVKTTCVCPFFIKTGMFDGAQSRWPKVLPLLEPEYAAEKIVRACLCDQDVLIMPLGVHLTPIGRALLPTAVFDELVEWMGVLDTMKDFKGRTQE